MNKILSKKVTILLCIVLYRLFLDYIYTNSTSVIWNYVGFLNNSTPYMYNVSWVVLIILSLLALPLFKSKELFIPDIIILFFLMRIVPYTVIIGHISLSNQFVIWTFVFWALVICLPFFIKLPPVKMMSQKGKQESNIVYIMLIVFSSLILFISGYYAHFRLHLTFDDIYDLRHDAKEFNLPLLIKYMWSATTNILPLLFVYYYKMNKKVICYFIAFVIVLNFSINGMKSTVFKLLLCFGLLFITTEKIRLWYIPSFIILSLISISETLLMHTGIFHDLIIRRVLFVPSLLDTFYYDYITKIGPIFYNRPRIPIQYQIGDHYMGSIDIECNNGLFSDAYMNMGIFGCFLYPVIYALFIKLCSSAFRYADKGLIVFAAIIMSYTLEGSEFSTSLLTHGLFLLAFTMYVLSSNQKKNIIKIK